MRWDDGRLAVDDAERLIVDAVLPPSCFLLLS
jgi:hypothetical protein